MRVLCFALLIAAIALMGCSDDKKSSGKGKLQAKKNWLKASIRPPELSSKDKGDKNKDGNGDDKDDSRDSKTADGGDSDDTDNDTRLADSSEKQGSDGDTSGSDKSNKAQNRNRRGDIEDKRLAANGGISSNDPALGMLPPPMIYQMHVRQNTPYGLGAVPMYSNDLAFSSPVSGGLMVRGANGVPIVNGRPCPTCWSNAPQPILPMPY